MKILITSPSLNTDENISGISSVVRFIIEANPQQQYIHFRLGRKDGEKRNAYWLLNMLRTYYRWVRTLHSTKDLLVHFNTSFSWFSVIRDFPMILAAHLMRKRMVIHLHGGDYMMLKKQPLWMRIIMRIDFSGTNPVIVLSPAEARHLERRIASGRIRILPNSINLHEAYEFERFFHAGRQLRLLFMGRISVDKGLEYIYRAMAALKTKGVKFTFVMAGRGPEEAEYVRKFAELLGSDFEFAGVVTGPGKTELLKTSDVFVLPSLYEGLPMALLESMSFGVVPVTTNVGSINQVVTHRHNGIFLRDHTPADIENAIIELSEDNRLLETLSRNAAAFIFRNFDPETYVSTLNEIYAYDQEY